MSVISAVATVTALCGCSNPVEYQGADSGIDAVLWRQVADFEDPLAFHAPSSHDPEEYLAGLGGSRWDGTTETLPDLRSGGVALYDMSWTDSTARFSVFITSGPRPDVPTDDGHTYDGPSQVYTCYGITSELDPAQKSATRTIFTECPDALVDQLPEDAAFASGEVFDG